MPQKSPSAVSQKKKKERKKKNQKQTNKHLFKSLLDKMSGCSTFPYKHPMHHHPPSSLSDEYTKE